MLVGNILVSKPSLDASCRSISLVIKLLLFNSPEHGKVFKYAGTPSCFQKDCCIRLQRVPIEIQKLWTSTKSITFFNPTIAPITNLEHKTCLPVKTIIDKHLQKSSPTFSPHFLYFGLACYTALSSPPTNSTLRISLLTSKHIK